MTCLKNAFCCADHELSYEIERVGARTEAEIAAVIGRFVPSAPESAEGRPCAYCGREGPRPGYNRGWAEK